MKPLGKSRFTNDEMDDKILELLELCGHTVSDIRVGIDQYGLRKADRDYELRQIRRRLQWLADYGFVDSYAGYWHIIQ